VQLFFNLTVFHLIKLIGKVCNTKTERIKMKKKNPIVGIIMGSDSDLKVMEPAFAVFDEFEIPFEVKILSAHRTPNQHAEYSKTAIERGLKVIIAAAGGAAHLPGVTAAHTTIPVIGVPVSSKSLDGMDSLLSIVQMPPGVPVATVGINGGKNSALLAVSFLSLVDESIHKKLIEFRNNAEEASMKKNDQLNN
jgi:5-(carboxyamino)imidazole ribonucleotide mutase